MDGHRYSLGQVFKFINISLRSLKIMSFCRWNYEHWSLTSKVYIIVHIINSKFTISNILQIDGLKV